MPSEGVKYRRKYYSTKIYPIVMNELITAARYRGYIKYQEIAMIMGLPLSGNYMSKEIGQILGEISQEEVKNGRPMLSVIAVGASGELGKGFFTLAKALGKQFDDTEEGRNNFWTSERQLVYLAWERELKR